MVNGRRDCGLWSRCWVPLVVAGIVLAAAPASAQSVLTAQPDPQHSILSQAFQDQTDRDTGYPLTDANRFELLENGVRSFPRKLDLIRSARHTLFLSTHLCRFDVTGRLLADELVAAVGRGVDVRFLVDYRLASRRFVRRLRRGGVAVVYFNSLRGASAQRSRLLHWKTVVADFRTAITGGTNLADAYHLGDGFNRFYKDTDVLVEGDAAAAMARAYLELWLDLAPHDVAARVYLHYFAAWGFAAAPAAGRHGVARFIPQESDRGHFGVRDYYGRCFDEARDQVLWHVNNIVPSGRSFSGLRAAAGRGVRVVLITNSVQACMARYGRLAGWVQYHFLRLVYRRRLAGSGVEIWEIDVPLHSKALTIDGVMASIGSYNLSSMSDQNLEGTLAVYDPPLVAEVEAMFARDLARSRRAQ